jgi:S-adenosyl-L-methionine methyltransferase
MSRLDSFIRRMQAQRACLDHAARLISALPGNVLEFGLGNGRTYDHLRETLPARDIYVFDRQLTAHRSCIPPADRLFLGDVLQTLPSALISLGSDTALANIDIGTGDDGAARELVGLIVPFLVQALKPGAVVVSGMPINHGALRSLALPHGVELDRHFLFSRVNQFGSDTIALRPANAPGERRCILASGR